MERFIIKFILLVIALLMVAAAFAGFFSSVGAMGLCQEKHSYDRCHELLNN